MRVIAGSAKGVRLAPVPAGIRPLSDRAREGLFSSLGGSVEGQAWADLFAGTGAVGIEALSRGAGSCLFVDSSAHAVRTIRENLDRTGLGHRARVIRADADRGLLRAEGPLDTVFLDPPYRLASGRLREVLVTATTAAPGGTLVLTRPSRDPTDVIPVHWGSVKVLTYGDARILICREAR
ncbi:MAG TPA: RsmD family RNA methyltransferase [Actinomycetota bacterium]|nr:RsmD family RNA methyltransferase [Actinomycetota bacterium]